MAVFSLAVFSAPYARAGLFEAGKWALELAGGELPVVCANRATGKLDIRQIDRRLEEAEELIAKRFLNISRELAVLRSKIYEGMSEQEYLGMVAEMGKRITALIQQAIHNEKEIEDLERKIRILEVGYSIPAEEGEQDTPDQPVVGKVVAVNRSWGFVVIDAGTGEGLRTNDEVLILGEGGNECKLMLREVEQKHAIADWNPEEFDVSVSDLVKAPLRRGDYPNSMGGGNPLPESGS